MVNLKRLNISISHERRFPGLITALCLGCPQSIEQLDICETHPYNDENHDDKNDDNDDSVLEEVGLGQLPDTKVLTHLRDLMLDDWDDIETAEEFLLVLEQCPNLEKIAMKWPLIPAEVDGAHIGRICPNLRSILYHGQGSIDDEGEDFWPIEIMETLPENQVESLEYQSSFDTSLNELLAKRTILRHSCTLRRVNLIASVSSAALRMVLEATPPTTPSAEENEIFSQLELFYRQIGKQKNLEHLDLYLGRHIDPETGKVQEGARALPGMLTLQDNAGGRPGYMDLLYGLSKLRMIGGDIAAETKDDKIPEDAPEVDWILKHWPSLYFPSTKFFPPSRIPAS
ncbi:hypothetical protein EC991_002104 [Linnemannia zychae]|nr:hypothetical protein EC991_002104 [Linnemannia zychae]